MTIFVTTLHVMLCFALILIILLQPGKDGAAAFGGGGGGNQMYGPRGSGSLLTRATTAVAALFMVTSITLAWFSNEKVQTGSDIDDLLEEMEQDYRPASTRARIEIPSDEPKPPAPPPSEPAPEPTGSAASGDAPAAGDAAPTEDAAAPKDAATGQ